MTASGAEAPHVVLIGGYLTEPLNYRRVRRRLLERGAASLTIAPVHAPDWLAAPLVGFGPLLMRVGRAIRHAHEAAEGRPLIVVGHSGGGILARLAMSPESCDGHRAAVADAVGCLVTLGTPHGLAHSSPRWRHRGVAVARFLEQTSPGAWFAPRTAYLTVGSVRVRASEAAREGVLSRLLGWPFRAVVGPLSEAGSDGIVSIELAHLPGARQLTFTDVRHGHIGAPWYGDAEIIDRWWPVAVELWRGALAARREAEPAAVATWRRSSCAPCAVHSSRWSSASRVELALKSLAGGPTWRMASPSRLCHQVPCGADWPHRASCDPPR